MIKDFLIRRARKQRELRSQLADTLLHRLERENTLTVDDRFIADMGVGRRLLFRVVYGMVIQERIHMMADPDGRVVLMTNMEFHRFMLRRSGMRETEIRRRDAAPVFADTVAEHAVSAREEDTVWIDSVAAELAPLSSEPVIMEDLDSTLVAATLGGSSLSAILPEKADENLDPLPVLAAPAARESRVKRTSARRRALVAETVPAGGSESDLGWFSLDVAPAPLPREKVPEARQSLPDRRREPWLAAEESGVDFE